MFTNVSYANMPFWGVLPMGMTNFGGDTQVFTMPEYAGGQIGYMLNPQAQAAMNGVGFNPWAGMPSQQDMQGMIDNYTRNLVTPALNNLASNCINTSLQNISMTKTRLNAMLQREGITNEQKQQINDLIDRLNAQEDKLKELTKSSNLDPETAYQKAREIEEEIRKIVNDASELAKAIYNTSTTTSTSTSTDETTSTKENTSTQENTSTKENTSTQETDDPEGASNVDKFSPEVIEMVDLFNDAIHVWDGTDNDTFDAVCSNITKDNVLEVMLAWNKYHSGQDGESFMEAFMWDANASQKKQFGKAIARALRDRAEELGVYDECRTEFAAIDKELNSLLWISNDISAQFDTIIAKMAAKSGSQYGHKLAKGENNE